MRIFETIKDNNGKSIYFLGFKIFETIKQGGFKKTYLLGFRVKKSIKLQLLIHKIEQDIQRTTAETKILLLGQNYKDLPDEQRFVLCFDHLTFPYAEAIDSWTFFEFLQRKGIPSKYAIRRENPLFWELEKEGRLKDILPVDDELQLLTDYPHIIAQSKIVISSFGFELSHIFKQLPFLKYVFIEHGVSFLKEFAIATYSADSFDAKLVPTVLTKQIYDSIGESQYGQQYYCGMPRWDRLQPHTKEKKPRKILIFFTWRFSVVRDRTQRNEYYRRIHSFVNKLANLFANRSDIQIYLALHHAIFDASKRDKKRNIKGIHFVPMSKISSMVNEADLCITDFSSISFDFLYRNVPVIYYCFDLDIKYTYDKECINVAAEKIDHHLYNGCRDEEEAVALVKHYADRDFKLEDEFIKKNDTIFWQKGNNCDSLWEQLNK